MASNKINDRQQTFDLLNKLYGNTEKEEKGYSLGDYTSLQVANELGYSSNQFSRILGEITRDQASEGTYQNLITRLTSVEKNRNWDEREAELLEQLSGQKKQYAIARKTLLFSLTAFIGTIIYFFGFYQSKIAKTDTGNTIISNVAVRRLVQAFEGYNMYEITLKALDFNERVKQGKVSPKEQDREIARLFDSFWGIIEKRRNDIKDMNLYFNPSNPMSFSDLAHKSYNEEQAKKNFHKALPSLISPTITGRDLAYEIADIGRTEQIRIEREIDNFLSDKSSTIIQQNENGLGNRRYSDNENMPSQLLVENMGQYASIFEIKGKNAALEMADGITDIIMEYYQIKKRPLNEKEKEEIVRKIQNEVRKKLGESRATLANQNYMITYRSKNIVDIIDHIIPIENCFKLSTKEMLAETMTDNATLYDEYLWNVKKVIFGEIRYSEKRLLKEEINNTIRSAQFEIRNEERRQFNYFQQYGEFDIPFAGKS